MARLNDVLYGKPTETRPASFTYSPQQEAIFEFVRSGSGNATIEAVAGAGKTTTLVELCKYLDGGAAFAAFNKKIADEIATKLVRAGVNRRLVKASTFHSFGFAAWRQANSGSIKVNAEKVWEIIEEIDVPKRFRSFVNSLVGIAKQSAAGILWDLNDQVKWLDLVEHFDLEEKLLDDHSFGDLDTLIEEGLEWTEKVLIISNNLAHSVVDFNDMIYAPLLFNARMWQNDWVLIDEAQDTNAVRRLLAAKMLKPGGRLIAVGDPHQAIYGFTGADANAMNLIREDFEPCVSLPLTVTYRCATKIVARAQRYVPHIRAANDALEGETLTMSYAKLLQQPPVPGDAILCRITKPLVQLAFRLIQRRIPAHVEGRDIGKGLLSLVDKWKTVYSCEDLRDRLEAYLEKERTRLADKPGKLARLEDQVETLLVIIDSLRLDDPVYEVRKVIEDLFRDTEGDHRSSITLSTVHKAKGREWDTVYILGPNKWMPHPFAKQVWELEQEQNLIYVATTRARRRLVDVIVS